MSITVSLPSLFHEQVLNNEPRLIEWGVHVAIDEDRNGTITFPDDAELTKHIDGEDRSIVVITMREAGHPVDRLASWSFDERTGGHR